MMPHHRFRAGLVALLAAISLLACMPQARAQGAGFAEDGSFGGRSGAAVSPASSPASSGLPEAPPLPTDNTALPPPEQQGGILVPVAEPVPEAPPAAQAPVPAEADTCAAYVSSPHGYAACKDRMMKIQRMRDASTQRAEDLKSYYDRIKGRTAPTEEKTGEVPEAK